MALPVEAACAQVISSLQKRQRMSYLAHKVGTVRQFSIIPYKTNNDIDFHKLVSFCKRGKQPASAAARSPLQQLCPSLHQSGVGFSCQPPPHAVPPMRPANQPCCLACGNKVHSNSQTNTEELAHLARPPLLATQRTCDRISRGRLVLRPNAEAFVVNTAAT